MNLLANEETHETFVVRRYSPHLGAASITIVAW